MRTFSLLYFYIFYTGIYSLGDSCPVSPSTVEIVDNCPDSEDKWREYAARKNCTVYASQFDDPQKLDYHCVINTFCECDIRSMCLWEDNTFRYEIYIYFTDEFDINYGSFE